MSAIPILLFAGLAYLSFIASSAWMVAFLLGFDIRSSGDWAGAWPLAVAIDIGLIALFGAVHSLMARPAFKRQWTRIIPAAAERAFYVLQSSCLLALIFWQWRPIPIPIWHIEGAGAALVLVVFATGLTTVILATFLLDHFEFTGLGQAWDNLRRRPPRAAQFRTPFLYRYVRHPLQTGILITLFAVPEMDVDGLLFAAAMVVYILVGLRFEERALLREFGAAYAAYRRDVPMLVPRPWRWTTRSADQAR